MVVNGDHFSLRQISEICRGVLHNVYIKGLSLEILQYVFWFLKQNQYFFKRRRCLVLFGFAQFFLYT